MHGTCRPQMEYVRGEVPQNDYLMVLSHELKLQTPLERERQEEEARQKHIEGIHV